MWPFQCTSPFLCTKVQISETCEHLKRLKNLFLAFMHAVFRVKMFSDALVQMLSLKIS